MLARDFAESFTFDAENRLTSNRLLSNSLQMQNDYYYDGAGTLARRKTWSYLYSFITPQNMTYIDGIFEERHDACNAPSGTTKYYMAFGRIIAQNDSGQVRYLLADHLGSNVGAITSTGGIIQMKYWPFGATRSGSTIPSNYAYTGQEIQTWTTIGAYNYKARFYSTMLGRFMSADPLGADSLNKYSYVLNNPVRFTDPSGLCVLGRTNCSEDEFQNLLRCAGGASSCAYPQGPLEIGPSGFSNWAESWQRFARWAVGQEEFWGHFEKLWSASAARLFHESVLFAMVEGGTSASDLDVFPEIGWTKIGEKFGVTGAFMFRSVFDLANGTGTILSLGVRDSLRATTWWMWLSPPSAVKFNNVLGGDAFDRHFSTVNQWFRLGTLQTYMRIVAEQGVDKARLEGNWSYTQWEILSGFVPVDPWPEARPMDCCADWVNPYDAAPLP